MCYDDKTEVLTEKGWRFFEDLIYEDRIRLATIDPVDLKIYYREPKRFIGKYYKGDMIIGRNRSINFKVTPDHRFLTKNVNPKHDIFYSASTTPTTKSTTLSSRRRYIFVDAKNLPSFFRMIKYKERMSDPADYSSVENTIKISHYGEYRINSSLHLKRVDFSGYVYNVEMEDYHTIITRRKGLDLEIEFNSDFEFWWRGGNYHSLKITSRPILIGGSI